VPNRLAAERSPYLLQHAENPVDWYPWGEEAFEKARREDKPIFLSVGYSTCHWCHVMERESFESPAVAEILNRDFVPVKVDREERPDVDRVYMTFVQATTGAGGWPMSVWLTPDLKPFFGGTYFPPESRWGRPGLLEVLQEIARVWKTDRARVERVADSLVARLREAAGWDRGVAGEAAPALAGPDTLAEGVEAFRRAFDPVYGGFGEAPKFPRPSELLFLLREHARTGDTEALAMVQATLRAMARGGVRDHLGGGFHRYSVDREWRLPHFEKMLYDQAQLALAYLEAGQASGDVFYHAVAEETLDYVRRDLAGPEGGFASAEDADSVPPEEAGRPGAHRREGAFYLWRDEEIGRLLGEDADLVRLRYGIRPGGNLPEDPHGELAGLNVLWEARSIDEVAAAAGRSPGDVEAALARARRVLLEARSRRPRPERDDKVLTAWNGLAIAAFARAARVVLDDEQAARHLETARRAARFVRDRLWRPEERLLLRRYRAGEAAIEGYAEDYACLVWGLLELFQADGDPAWLEWALELQARLDELFWDEEGGGWFSTSGRDPSVLVRLKEDYDGAEPAAGSVAAMNQLWLAHLTGERGALAKAERALARLGPHAGRAARAIPFLAGVLSAWHAGLSQIVLVGAPGRSDTLAFRRALASRYRPFALVIPVAPGPRQEALARRLPWIGAMTMREGKATVYECRDFVCREPITDPEAL
jgi:uncharacterized protein YyaL (SSP411 family)